MIDETFPVEQEYVVVGAFVSHNDTMHLNHLMIRGLHQGEYLPRRVAAHVLALVASAGQTGNISDDVNPEMIGAAIGRLVSNYDDGDWLERFMRGLMR